MPIPLGIIKNKVIGDIMDTTMILKELEEQPLQNEMKKCPYPGEIAETEIAEWKADFQQIGLLEEIDPKTKLALSNSKDQYGLLTEPVLWVTHEDSKRNRLTGFWFNRVNLLKPLCSLIATSKRLIFVDPQNEIVQCVEYKNINQIEREIRGTSCIYTILTKSGNRVYIKIRFNQADDETNVDAFFERIANPN
jgi:hypothetical protein